MPKYTVVVTQSVQKYLKKSPERLATKLEAAMLSLELNPRPYGFKKLKGREAYRIRAGNYRIIYEIEDRALRVIIIDAGNRKEIY